MPGGKLCPGIIDHIFAAERIDGKQIALFEIIGIALDLADIQRQVVPGFDEKRFYPRRT
jgi:hypothetical protein